MSIGLHLGKRLIRLEVQSRGRAWRHRTRPTHPTLVAGVIPIIYFFPSPTSSFRRSDPSKYSGPSKLCATKATTKAARNRPRSKTSFLHCSCRDKAYPPTALVQQCSDALVFDTNNISAIVPRKPRHLDILSRARTFNMASPRMMRLLPVCGTPAKQAQFPLTSRASILPSLTAS
jgi:hypothetical protein